MGDSYPKLKVAAVQAAPVFLNREATVEKACNLILEAGQNGARVVAFPECFIPGYPYWVQFYLFGHPLCGRFNKELFKNAVEIPGPATEALCRAARKANVYVVMGLNERRPGLLGTLYNSHLYIDPRGQILGKRQKLMPTINERLVHGLGDGSFSHPFLTEFGAIGGLICCENGNPLLRFAMVAQGEVIHVASWPSFAGPHAPADIQETMFIRIRNYAWEGRLFVISTASIFTKEIAAALQLSDEVSKTIGCWGGKSAILGPKGQYLAGPADYGETIVYADIDLEEIVAARMTTDYTGHYNRFDVLSLNLNLSPNRAINYVAPEVRVIEGPAEPEAQEAVPTRAGNIIKKGRNLQR